MKIIFSGIALLITLAGISQVRYGVFAAPQITGARYIINDTKQETSSKIGINAGFQLKIPFENRLSFAPSVMYNLRGFKTKFNKPSFPPDSTAVENNVNFHTLQLGFLLQHDFVIEPGHYFIRFGPSLDFALFGREKFETKSKEFINRNMKFGFADYGRYLASFIVQVGFEAKNGFFAYGYYDYGLTTMNNFDLGPTIVNRAAGVSIGTYFSKKPAKSL